ncbi:MAG: aspartate kinase [Acidobacteriota bacterium]
MKFGGTSVQDAERIGNVARIAVARREERPVIVTSAMSGVTNELVRLADMARRGDRSFLDDGIGPLQRRHLAVAEQLAPHDSTLREVLELQLRELRVLLRGICLTARATPQALDALLGCGELLAQELVVAAIRVLGGQAVAVDAREVVITDDSFGAARPDLPRTARRCGDRVVPWIEQGVIPVLGGYVGATPDGVPTTLGRGGSDLSASVLGLGLSATSIEIWTDVDGLMSADPRVEPNARLLSHVSFLEAAELAGFGAKVLHPASIDPAVRAGIPVRVCNSLFPDRPGTWIDAEGSAVADGIRAVVSRSGVSLLSLIAPGATRNPEFLITLLRDEVPSELGVLAVVPGPVGVDLLIANGPELTLAEDRLAKHGRLECRRGLGMVAVIGEGIGADAKTWIRVATVAAPWTPLRIATGPRGASLHLVCDETALSELVRALHQSLVRTDVPANSQSRP